MTVCSSVSLMWNNIHLWQMTGIGVGESPSIGMSGGRWREYEGRKDDAGHWLGSTLCLPLTPNILFWNKWRKKIEKELANHRGTWKAAIKIEAVQMTVHAKCSKDNREGSDD